MAQYTVTARTSYFRVTDEERYSQLMELITADEVWNEIVTDEKTGKQVTWHGFGSYQPITFYQPLNKDDENIKDAIENGEKLYDKNGNEINIENLHKYKEIFNKNGTECIASIYDEGNYGDIDKMLKEIQKILHPDDAFIYMSVDHEGLRYVSGFVTIVTKNEIRNMDTETFIKNSLNEMLGPELSKKVKYMY